MAWQARNRVVDAGTRVVLAVLFAVGCFLWWRSSDQADSDDVTRTVERQMTQGEYSKLYTALKTHFPDDFAAERDGLARLTRANAGQDDFAVFLRISQDQLEARHVDDFAGASSGALATFRTAEIAWKEALYKQSAENCRSSSAMDITPGEGMRNSRSVPVEVGEMDYAMVMAMADGRKAKIRRAPPTQADFEALYVAMAQQGMTSADIGVAGRTEQAPGRSAEEICTLDLKTLKAIDSLPPAQADVFTVVSFRNIVNALSQQAGRAVT